MSKILTFKKDMEVLKLVSGEILQQVEDLMIKLKMEVK